jgi:class 3 adenylate cyclase
MQPPNKQPKSVKRLLLSGVFWRILAIEIILLAWTLGYHAYSEGATAGELFWYALRIGLLVAIILTFMMITLGSFLQRRIITPLEAIAESNRSLKEQDQPSPRMEVSPDAPLEIQDIVATRNEMLDTILEVSAERLRLVELIRHTFGRYVSGEVVDRILDSPEGASLGGQSRLVTIMVTDLRGFTALSGRLDPERVVQMLNAYFEVMVEVILSYGGTIIEITGDGFLVVFGAPEEMPDQAQRAVACALDMQGHMKQVNQHNRRQGLPALEMGVGLNQAEVVAGNIGSSQRSKYAVVGDGVNLASRIESYAVGNQVLVSESIQKALGGLLRIDGELGVLPKGSESPLRIFLVGGIGGEYNLSLEEEPLDLVELRDPVPLSYVTIAGKHVGSQTHECRMTKLAATGAELILDQPVEPLTNLRLSLPEAEGELAAKEFYAKVMESHEGREGGHFIRFTGVPPEVDAYFQALRGYAVRKPGLSRATPDPG